MYLAINALAVFLGSLSVYWLLRRAKCEKKDAVALAIMLALGILSFGFKIEPDFDSKVIYLGFSSLRGVLGAAFVLAIIYKWKNAHIQSYTNATIASLPLMYSIAKLGCILRGCCHGFEYDGLMAYEHDGNSYFPVQLLEVVVFLMLYIIALWLLSKKENLMLVFPFIALLAKFALDYLRAERAGIWIFSWNQIGIIALLTIWAICLIIRRIKRN